MTDNYYVYIADLPVGVTEMVCPCIDGYTIYIDSKLDHKAQCERYLHAVHHIVNNDFEREDIQSIEYEAHKNALLPQGAKGIDDPARDSAG